MSDWKYVYVEDGKEDFIDEPPPVKLYPSFQTELEADPNVGLTKKRGVEWEKNFTLPPVMPHTSFKDLPDGPCDEDHPRVFHMFWTGPFTDKPYLALLSFLYTQNLVFTSLLTNPTLTFVGRSFGCGSILDLPLPFRTRMPCGTCLNR